MRVTVLGASGYVGRALVRHLRSRSIHTVAALRHIPGGDPGSDTRVFEATDAASVAAAIDGASHIVSCVMGTPVAMEGVTRNLTEAAIAGGTVRRVVHLSSIAVFGDLAGNVSEDAEKGIGVDWYGASKVRCEDTVRSAAARGLSTVILRPGLVYGPGSPLWSMRIGHLLRARRLGDLGENGDGTCNLVHRDDVVRAIANALEAPVSGSSEAFNLDDPAPPTWNEYLMAFGRDLGAVPIARIPSRQLRLECKILAPALRLAEMVVGRVPGRPFRVPPPISPGLARLFTRTARYNSGRADLLLDGQWTSWPDGVRETARQWARGSTRPERNAAEDN